MRRASTSPDVRILPVELPVRRKSLAKAPDAFQRPLAAPITVDTEGAVTRQVDLDLGALFRSRALTTDAGRRMARLLPHFETCMAPCLGIDRKAMLRVSGVKDRPILLLIKRAKLIAI
jgi:hypothetical protein